MKIRAGVIGATGYTGEEIVRLLAGHKGAEITYLTSRTEKPVKYSDNFSAYKGIVDTMLENLDMEKALSKVDVAFLSLPHTVSMQFTPGFLKAGKKIIDLSADYRLSTSEFAKWYKTEHTDKDNIKNAVYGLPEIYRDKIKKASLVANPGCYPTSVILAALPVLKNKILDGEIIADSKSGVTGAGRKASIPLSFGEVSENFKAYKVNDHQHMPEMTKIFNEYTGSDVKINFIPHLLPVRRGILSTVYMPLKKTMDDKEAVNLYKEFYKREPFIRVYDAGKYPELKDVFYKNYCDIGIKVSGNLMIVVSCIDNLMKGAAGQAVQNMNIMFGLDETEGLK